MKKPPFKAAGSVGWLVFWIIFFWPVAIAYYCMRSWGQEKKIRLDWERKNGWR